MSKPIDDEWWTTDMVCAHLKLSKRALWDIRNAPAKGFPLAIKPGGKVNLFRAAEVRAWMAARMQIGVRASKTLAGEAPIAPPPLPPSPEPTPPPLAAPAVQASSPVDANEALAPAKKPRRGRKGQKATDPDQLPLF